MNTADWLFLGAGAVVAAGATVLTTHWTETTGTSSARAASARAPFDPSGDPSGAAAGAPGAADATLARLERTLSELRGHQAELQRALDELAASKGTATPATRRAAGEVERAVAAWMEGHAHELLAGAGAPSSDAERRAAIELALETIQNANWSDEEEAAFWQQLRASDQLDGVLAALEESVEASPYDADLHVDLATAYGQKVFALGAGPQQSHFRQKQDEAYDTALELVPAHWGARFGKAMGLSEWPSFLGKRSEAIHQFELLAKQQEGRPREQRFLQTYFFLGNLYRESGRPNEALATWRRGLAEFPGTRVLQEQVSQLQPEEL